MLTVLLSVPYSFFASQMYIPASVTWMDEMFKSTADLFRSPVAMLWDCLYSFSSAGPPSEEQDMLMLSPSLGSSLWLNWILGMFGGPAFIKMVNDHGHV